MEHYRMFEGKVGLSQGYYCLTCGKPTAMLSPRHGPGVCEPNVNLVKELQELNSPRHLGDK